jgi:hypothetical protein
MDGDSPNFTLIPRFSLAVALFGVDPSVDFASSNHLADAVGTLESILSFARPLVTLLGEFCMHCPDRALNGG